MLEVSFQQFNIFFSCINILSILCTANNTSLYNLLINTIHEEYLNTEPRLTPLSGLWLTCTQHKHCNKFVPSHKICRQTQQSRWGSCSSVSCCTLHIPPFHSQHTKSSFLHYLSAMITEQHKFMKRCYYSFFFNISCMSQLIKLIILCCYRLHLNKYM